MKSILHKNISNHQVFRLAILAYWTFFWLFNSLDKIFGGSSFMWVGRDRFAQFQKFFASAGLASPIVANIALVLAAALEIFAFLFFLLALIYYLQLKQKQTRSYYLLGIILTLITFTFFAIGDHIFGDRFELLEHTLFWFITLFSWVTYNYIDKISPNTSHSFTKKQIIIVSCGVILLVLATSLSIGNYNKNYFFERSAAVEAKKIGDNMYKVAFPFLGGSTVFENSLKQFKKENPTKRIDHIYTAPDPLRLKKADGLIFYIITEDK